MCIYIYKDSLLAIPYCSLCTDKHTHTIAPNPTPYIRDGKPQLAKAKATAKAKANIHIYI